MRNRLSRWSSVLAVAFAFLLFPECIQGQDTSESPIEDDFEDFDDFDEINMPEFSDPFEGFNRAVFKFNNTAIKYGLQPIADGYETVVPPVGRRGLRSFFENLRYPIRFVSCLLQGKVERSIQETAKFVVNTTVGIGGFFDIAGQNPELSKVPSEDIGQAMGKWGIGNGPYLVLPLLGPSSGRELAGSIGDSMLSPVNRRLVKNVRWEWGLAYVTTNTVRGLPERLRTFDELEKMSVDPYIALRNGFLQYRDSEVKR